MAGSFKDMGFDQVNLNDPFFDSLKADYEGFPQWFAKKAAEGVRALVVESEGRIDAFLYLKRESDETIILCEGFLPAEPRLKIGTLKIADHVQGTRLGEGAVGLALWNWRDTGYRQVYVTVYPRHTTLLEMLEKFGFTCVGEKADGELVMVKDRSALDYSDPFRSFPFVDPGFAACHVLPIEDRWHDKLFPYSELAGSHSDDLNIAAGNGVSKIYLASPKDGVSATQGNPILIYRMHTGGDQKTYRSAITSFGLVTGVHWYKRKGKILHSLKDLDARVRNKSVFTGDEIADWYHRRPNLVVLELLYLGYFGPGNNVNHRTLCDSGLWRQEHPYTACYTADEFKRVLTLGRFDVAGVVVD